MLSRRQLLKYGGASALATLTLPLLTVCCAKPIVPESAWKQLKDRLSGQLVRPENVMYHGLGLARNLAYSDIRPGGIVLCANVKDVQTAVKWALDNGLPPVPQSPAAHSYAGYSATTGLSIDLSRLSGVKVDAQKEHAELGAGGMLGAIGNALWRYGLMFPSGQCQTVGVSGLLLAGGMGFNSRKFGMTCDQLLEAEIVTANGEILHCNEKENSDLFWALRGGGGGTFGICTSYKVRVYDVQNEKLSVFRLYWSGKDDIQKAFAAMQKIAVSAPNDFSMLATLSNPGGKLSFRAQGQFYGKPDDLKELLSPFPERNKALDEQFASSNYIDGTRFLSELGAPNAFMSKSAFYDAPLPHDGIDKLLEWMSQLPMEARSGSTTFFAYGGKITADAPDTAFVHRKGAFLREGCVSWYPGSQEHTIRIMKHWLTRGFKETERWANGSAFSNFMDRTQANWQTAYYGDNFSRLVAVKTKYDPNDLFHFEQSIPTSTA